MKRKPNPKATNPTEVETLHRIRKDWGDVKPYTRVHASCKSYNRQAAKLQTRRAARGVDDDI